MFRLFLILAALFVPYAGWAASSYLKNAIDEALARGDSASALELVREAVSKNDSDAMIELGLWYAEARFVERDTEAAYELFSRSNSANNGDAIRFMIWLGARESLCDRRQEINSLATQRISELSQESLNHLIQLNLLSNCPTVWSEGMRFLRYSASRGDIDSTDFLASILTSELNPHRSIEEAITRLEDIWRTAQQDNRKAFAAVMLAKIYREFQEFKNPERAELWEHRLSEFAAP